jgi:hypothetical protein
MGHKSDTTQTVNSDNVKQSVLPDTPQEPEVEEAQPQPTRNLYQRWNAVLSEIRSVEKRGENKDQKYDYMKAADVLKELRPLFAKHGLVLKANPRADNIDDSEYQSKSGSTAHYVRLEMHYTLINCDDPTDRDELIGIGDSSDYSDKALNKARTGALKYTLRDNFLIDDQDDVADSETETPDRAGPQNKVGRQPQAQTPVQFSGRSQQFTGSIVECEQGESENGSFMWFTLHDRTDKMYTFRQEDVQWVKVNNRVVVTCSEKQGRQGKIYWQVTELSAPLTPDFINGQSKAAPKPIAVLETANQILKRMFPEPKDAKRKRLIEALLENQPESLHAKILQSFEKRMKSENPSTETGMMALLDISITAVTEEAAELFPSEAATQ